MILIRVATLGAVGLLLAGCNAAQSTAPALASQGTASQGAAASGQPSPAQVAARNAWLACLDQSSRSQSRLGRAAAADFAFSACQAEEGTLVARLSQDPSLTPTSARVGLQRVKADWKLDHLRRG
jgi:hypothetical protein